MYSEINDLIEELIALDDIRIITIGGSRAKQNYDENSDYDIYLYYNKKIDLDVRKNILCKYTKYMEFGNIYWEEEDDGVLNNGVEIELIYRDINFLNSLYNDKFINSYSSFGYSTCMLDNAINSFIVCDKDGLMSKFAENIKNYPSNLRKNIIFNNLELLYDKMPSLGYQVIKALKRKDLVSINHRLAEFLAIYFDIIFALNNKYHPGEKRLLGELETLKIKPSDSKIKIEKLLKIAMTDNQSAIKLLEEISNDLYKLVNEEFEEYTKSFYCNF